MFGVPVHSAHIVHTTTLQFIHAPITSLGSSVLLATGLSPPPQFVQC